MRFTFEVAGVKEFDRSFNRVEGHIKDLRPVWDEIVPVFFEIEKRQFGTEGGAGRTGKWKPLTANYARWKAVQFPGAPILQRTGRLMRSLTGKTSDTVIEKKEQEFAIGSRVPYGKYHQTGTRARPPISFSDQDRRDLQKGIQKGLLTVIRKDNQIKLGVEG